MFNDIGKKIKILATIIAYLGIAFSIMFGFVNVFSGDNIMFGICIMFFGPLFSWVSTFVLYGFGQLVDNSDKFVKWEEKKYNEENDNDSKLSGVLDNMSESIELKNNKNTNNFYSEELMNQVDELLMNVSEEEIKEIKKTFKDWYQEIQKLSINDLIERLNNVGKWQAPYIILCCVEIKERI